MKIKKANKNITGGDINSIRTSYKHYKSLSKNPVNSKTYIEVANEFMKYLIDKLLEDGKIKLPCKLGHLIILGKKIQTKWIDGIPVTLAPDWKATKDLWNEDEEAKSIKQIVYHTNDNTNGVRYRTRWLIERSPVINKKSYNFILARKLKRTIAKNIKEGKEYIIVENGKKFKIY